MIKPIEFQAWPKIARLNRDIVVTEKIDGTNAAILIQRGFEVPLDTNPSILAQFPDGEGGATHVAAQSRTRLLEPGADNFGFAAWVKTNAIELVEGLGEGRHFGEWWGSGIQRGYDQPKGLKHFSLFNTHRHADTRLELEGQHGVSIVAPVPVLGSGPFGDYGIKQSIDRLVTNGSLAAPGYMSPEGFVVFHTAANICFKVLLEGDDRPKGA